MTHSAAVHNPFLLMLNPEIVLAAIEKSERLSQLKRHLCRPLDKPTPSTAAPDAVLEVETDQDDDSDSDSDSDLVA